MNNDFEKIIKIVGWFLIVMIPVDSFGQFARKTQGDSTIAAPFGFPNSQPPEPGSVVDLADFEVGFEAQQVCGYTDWSTIQLKTPRKLLSKEYWRKVGGGLVDEATRLAMSLTGALPSMLACNVSPTYCHILNQAEHMAALEGQLTFETCEMLDGVANQSFLQADGLRNCVSNQMKRNRDLSASEARERCLTKPSDAGLSKNEKIRRTASLQDSSDSFKMATFINEVFPSEVRTSSGSNRNLKSGVHGYSRIWDSKNLMTEMFPGIEVRGSSSVMKGGTFNAVNDKIVAEHEEHIEKAIVEILVEMKPLYDAGKSPAQIIRRTKRLWNDRVKWFREGKPSPLHRGRADGGEPEMLITPQQMVMLLPLADPTQRDARKAVETDLLRQVIQRLSTATAHVQVNDMLSDVYTRTLDRCRRDPKYQGAVAQENCKAILARTKTEMEVLNYKLDAEKQARAVQMEVASLVQSVQSQSLRGMKARGKDTPEPADQQIKNPGSL